MSASSGGARSLINEHGMNPVQKAVVDEWIAHKNGTKAYLSHHPDVSHDVARANASRLLAQDNVKAYVKVQTDKINTKAEKKAVISVTRILQEEARISYSSISDIYDPEGSIIPPHQLPVDVAHAIKGVEEISKVIAGPGDEHGLAILEKRWKYSFWDKGASLNRLEKHKGMFGEDNAQRKSNGVGVVVPVSISLNQLSVADMDSLQKMGAKLKPVDPQIPEEA